MSSLPLARPRPYWLWPLAVLLGEYLWISVQFDALPLLESAGVAGQLGRFGVIAPLFIVIATVTYIVSGRRLRDQLAVALASDSSALRRHSFGLGANLVCFGGLHLLTAQLLERAASEQPIGAAWFGLWLLLAAGTFVSLLLSLLPVRGLWLIARSAADVLAIGCVAGALAWSAGLASEQLWLSLSTVTLQTVYLWLWPFSGSLIYSPEDAAIGTDAFVVIVAPECSGIEGIGLILVVMGVYLWSARKRLRFPRALWVFPIAVAAVWIGNSLRIALLIAVGINISPEIALSGFHSKAGWIFFCAIALGLIAIAQRVSWLKLAASNEEEAAATWNPAATYLSPLLALIATSLATALFSTGFDRFYGLRILAVLLVLYLQRRFLPRPSWAPTLHAPLIGIALFGLWYWSCPRPDLDSVMEFKSQIAQLGQPWAGLWIALRAFGAIVTVPIAEELAFRGFLLRRLIGADFSEVDKRRLTPLSLAVSSLAFGLLHPGAVLIGTLAGVAYGYAQAARGRISDAVIAHGVTNGLIAIAVLVFDQYWLWL
jgi:exosortase E/protease (VPEID-CTERM system)